MLEETSAGSHRQLRPDNDSVVERFSRPWAEPRGAKLRVGTRVRAALAKKAASYIRKSMLIRPKARSKMDVTTSPVSSRL